MNTFKILLSTILIMGLNLSFAQTARLQVIHNAADPGAVAVDIYLNGTLLLDNFGFREATPFIDAPAGTPINIGVAGPNSTSVGDTIKNFNVTLTANEKYVAIANGVLSPGSFASNPDGRSTAFTLFIKTMARESGTGSDVDFFVLHGSTDAPTVDVIARGVATLVDNAAYGDITGYIPVPPVSYILDIATSGDNPSIVASFQADLSGLGGGAAAVFASGFLDPSSNQNGEAFGIFAALPNGTVVEFPSVQLARLQVIHNAADIAADPVDIYLNGALLLNDFAFRAASPFIDAPAGVELNIGVAPGNSGSASDTLKNFQVTLENGETYVAIANGVLNPSQYASNPDGRSTAFTLFIKTMARESGTGSDVDFFVLHGSTDAPTVDVIARGVATLVDNAAYGDITGYIPVPPASYILDVTPGNNNSTIVASFEADLSGLGGGAAVVFASGFLDPSANQNGEAFGIFAALSNGTVVAFPSVQLARLQVIHNAADIAADPVDIYLNGALLLNDFAFRAATPFIDAPAGVELNIGVAPGNSGSVSDTLKNFAVTLENGETYVAIANGVLNPSQYASNPDGRSTAFTLFIKTMARESGTGSDVDFFVIHGATDAPTVDVIARDVATLVDNAAYGDITSYIPVPAGNYTLDLTLADGTTLVQSYWADLRTLGGKSAVVFASGFLNPSANQNGEAFGIFAALPNGIVVQFPDGVASVENIPGVTPSNYTLDQNYPNPFNPSTTINFTIPNSDFVTLKVYNILGSEVATLVNENLSAGSYKFNFDARNLASGVYLYELNAGNFREIKKMNLLK